jgi:hypothetical protein
MKAIKKAKPLNTKPFLFMHKISTEFSRIKTKRKERE